MADAHKNFAYGTVLTAPSPATSGPTLVLNSGQGALMPTAPFNATVWPAGGQPLYANAEIVRVTAVSGDTLTIVRTQEGSSARTIVAGDQFAATITNKSLTDIENASQPIFNVKAYGAVGDGTTNDGTTIQAAITAAGAAGGGTVFFPKGTYLINTGLSTTSDNINFIGAGHQATTIKAGAAMTMLHVGGGSGPTVYKNYRFEGMTLDMNLISDSFMYGAVFEICQNVLIKDVWILNSGAAPTRNQLFFGTTVGSSSEYARNLIIEDCNFDNNTSNYESVLLAQAHNVKVINSRFANVSYSGTFGLLQYGSTQVSISGCTFESANLRLDTWPTVVTNCRFEAARLRVTGVTGSKIIGNTFDGGSSYATCGIYIEGYIPGSTAELAWFDTGLFPFTRPCSNVVISGNDFYRCSPSAIYAYKTTGTQSGSSVTVLDADSLIITNNTFRKSNQLAVDVKANRLVLAGNIAYNSNQSGTASLNYNYAIGAKQGLISNNHSYDDQGTPTVTHDYFIDNQFSGLSGSSASLITTQNLRFVNNNFEVASSPYYYTGAGFTATQPSNVTLTDLDTAGTSSSSPNFSGTVTAGGLNVDSNTLYVDSINNKVGIGTGTPKGALTVTTVNATGANVPSSWAGIFGGRFGLVNNDLTFYFDLGTTYAEFSSYNYGNATTVPLVLNANGGSVGIGANRTNPSSTLDVNGTITGTGIVSNTNGIGYTTGAGGTVTQATSKATAVTLNKATGEITLNAASLAAATIVTFVLNNTTVAATDMIMATHHATGTFGAYTVNARATGAGAASISIRNNSAAALAEAIVIKFAVIKAVTA